MVVRPRDGRHLRQVEFAGRRQDHGQGDYSARKTRDKNLVHSAIEPAVNRGDRYIVPNQLRVFDFVGALFLKREPGDFWIDDKGGAFAGRVERNGL